MGETKNILSLMERLALAIDKKFFENVFRKGQAEYQSLITLSQDLSTPVQQQIAQKGRSKNKIP